MTQIYGPLRLRPLRPRPRWPALPAATSNLGDVGGRARALGLQASRADHYVRGVLTHPPGGQRFVVMVVTGSLNRRSA
jgi:hypothetical protein